LKTISLLLQFIHKDLRPLIPMFKKCQDRPCPGISFKMHIYFYVFDIKYHWECRPSPSPDLRPFSSLPSAWRRTEPRPPCRRSGTSYARGWGQATIPEGPENRFKYFRFDITNKFNFGVFEKLWFEVLGSQIATFVRIWQILLSLLKFKLWQR